MKTSLNNQDGDVKIDRRNLRRYMIKYIRV
jgi:hypothetical protein